MKTRYKISLAIIIFFGAIFLSQAQASGSAKTFDLEALKKYPKDMKHMVGVLKASL